ncbi:MAG TPA: hypothetical protein VFX59_31010 [Polyangiales bacterium]|nr:hypothetical protein [Polyangiales bacterium]
MTIRTWLSAALVVALVSISSSSLADSRLRAQRYEPAAEHMERTRIAQSRAGRAVRATPPPAPARAKQAKLEPKPPSNAARQSSSASGRTGRGRQ